MEERTTTITKHGGRQFAGGGYYKCGLCDFKGSKEYYGPIIEIFQYCPMCGARIRRDK